MKTIVASPAREVLIGDDKPTVIIGERINPTGKKKFQEELKVGNLETVRKEALTQTQAGADILDVNVGVFGINEVELLPRVVQEIAALVDTPLCIDSANHEALEAALRVYKGKPLVNSVSGEERSLSRVLPLIKQYGAAVIGLVQDDEGIPQNTERRVSIAHKIVERAEKMGIPREDILIDVETFSVGADATAGPKIIEAIRRIKMELGVNVTLAVSNVSFGLPERTLLNNAFVAMAIAAGATCFIADIVKIQPAVLAADLIFSRDKRSRRYIEAHRLRLQKTEV
ncbi:MAG: dihydropteroate synthase [Syntrophales bacterium]